MTHYLAHRATRLAVLAMAATLAACTTALAPTSVPPAVPLTGSVEQANSKLAEVAAVRAAVEAEYAASERICYTKFFVNNCLDDAKEKRRIALAYQNAVEDEAQYFKRKAAVDERDREVAKSVKEFEEEEARAAAAPPPAPRDVPVPHVVAPKATLAARRASQEAKQARHEAQQQADAPKRAASARAFEQRKLDAEQRQREVAEKVAAKKAKAEAAASAK